MPLDPFNSLAPAHAALAPLLRKASAARGLSAAASASAAAAAASKKGPRSKAITAAAAQGGWRWSAEEQLSKPARGEWRRDEEAQMCAAYAAGCSWAQALTAGFASGAFHRLRTVKALSAEWDARVSMTPAGTLAAARRRDAARDAIAAEAAVAAAAAVVAEADALSAHNSRMVAALAVIVRVCETWVARRRVRMLRLAAASRRAATGLQRQRKRSRDDASAAAPAQQQRD